MSATSGPALASAVLSAVILVGGCEHTRLEQAVVEAINMGGSAYHGVDGTRYLASASVRGGRAGQIGGNVSGTQDPALYRTYRRGDFKVSHAVRNGVYDLTLTLRSRTTSVPATGSST